ncbi:phage tail tape measure protein [Peribacillus sp. NPDC046944]|uniref:phage tail tape measure protein n=1 Tax=unclassified Peribacillus TaxID=2675266 RepID=UPI003CFC055A
MAKSLRQTTMKVKIDVDSKQLKTANDQIDYTVKSAEKLEKASEKSSKAIEQTGASAVKSTDSLKKNAKSTESVHKENEKLSKSAKNSGDSLKDQAVNSNKAKDSMDNLASSSVKLKEVFATIGAAAFAKQMYDLGASAIQVGMDFDKGMSEVKAVAEASAKDFEAMRKQAIQLGADTTKSAKEVSAGQLELAKSGLSAKQAMAAIPGAINASTASGEEMSVAVSVMTSALNGFQLEASESAHVADVLAMAANKSKADISDMGYAFKYAATPAKALGITLEETSAATMIMTNAGLAGEQAGTSLRSALISLAKPSEDAGKKLDVLGVAITNNKGNMRPFALIMNELRDKTDKMGNAQKLAALSTIFGTEAATGMLSILDSAPGTMEKFTKSLKESDGASKKAADTMTDNLAGSVEEFKGSIESASVSVSDILKPTVREGTEALTDLVGGFNDLSPSAKSMAVWGGVIVGGVIPASIAIYKVHKAVKSVREVMGGAKGFFESYRKQMQLTGAQAVITAKEIQAMNKEVTGGSVPPKGKGKSVGTGGGSGSSGGTTIISTEKSKGGTKPNHLIDPKTGMLKNTLGNGSKLSVLGKGSKAIPVLGTAVAVGSLALGGKENLGSNTGSISGGAAGAAAGAAIGSLVPGIGTAIGGLVGGIAGSVFGEKFGSSVQKHWPNITKKIDSFTEKHPLLTKVAAASNPILRIAQGAKSAKKDLVDSLKEPLSSTVEFGKGVSKTSAKAINDYKKLSDKATEQLDLLYWSGDKVSKKTAKSLKANYGAMADSIQKSMKSKFGKTEKTLSSFLKDSGLSAKEQNAITKNVEKNHKKQKDTVEKYQKQINKIINKASKENRSITKKEQQEINKLKEKMNSTAVKSLSKSAKEQRTIMTILKEDSGRISAKQAADVVKQSKKARNGAKEEAEKKYKEVIAAADTEYYDNKSISKAQYEAIKDSAEKTKDKAVEHAEEMHEKVVEQAKKQATGHLKQVDWETGESLSKWEQFKINLAKKVNSISDGINIVLKAFGLEWEMPTWNPKGSSSSSSGKKVASNAKGTGYHPGGLSVVGEEGPELAYTPYGEAQIVGGNGAEIVNLPRGAKVLTASQTSQMFSGGLNGSMPGYAGGIGGSIKDAAGAIQDASGAAYSKTKDVAGSVYNKAKDVTASTVSTVTEITDDVLDFITDPKVAIQNLINKNPLKNDMMGIGGAAFKKIKEGAASFIEDKLSFSGGTGITGGASAWSKMILRAAAQTQTSLSGGQLQGIIAQIQRESGGNEKIIQSAAVNDINIRNNNPARGLLQYIPQTFASYKLKGFSDIMNGYHQLLAFFNNSNWKKDLPYGKRGWGPTGSRRFAKGGQVNQNGQVLVGEEGPELVDLPFGSYVNNNRKTNDLLNKKGNSDININLSPTIHINLEGSKGETNESAIQRAVSKALEETFKDLRGLFDSGVAY